MVPFHGTLGLPPTLPSPALLARFITSSTISAPVGRPTPTVNFTQIPNQVDTCTGEAIPWTSTGIYPDESISKTDSIVITNPLSVLAIGIAGSYISPEDTINQLSLDMFIPPLTGDATPKGNVFGGVSVPPGIYIYYATLFVNSNESVLVGTYNFISNVFSVVKGSDTSCIVYDYPDPGSFTFSRTPSSSPTIVTTDRIQTSTSAQSQVSTFISTTPVPPSRRLANIAIEGIIGGIVLIIIVFGMLLYLRARARRVLLRRNRIEQMNRMQRFPTIRSRNYVSPIPSSDVVQSLNAGATFAHHSPPRSDGSAQMGSLTTPIISYEAMGSLTMAALPDLPSGPVSASRVVGRVHSLRGILGAVGYWMSRKLIGSDSELKVDTTSAVDKFPPSFGRSVGLYEDLVQLEDVCGPNSATTGSSFISIHKDEKAEMKLKIVED